MIYEFDGTYREIMNRCLSQLPCSISCFYHSDQPNNDFDIGQHSDTKLCFNVFFVVEEPPVGDLEPEDMGRVVCYQSCTAHAYSAICSVMQRFFEDHPGLVRSFFPVEEWFNDHLSRILSKFNVGPPVLRRNSISIIVEMNLITHQHMFVMDDIDTIEQSYDRQFSPTWILLYKGSLFRVAERISFQRPFFLRYIRDYSV